MKAKVICLLVILGLPVAVSAETTITYQGQLQKSGQPHTDTVDMEFRLYDSLGGSNQVGPTIEKSNVPVEDGLFQVLLDFGDVYDQPRWLQVAVEGNIVLPRHRLASVPVAIRSLGDTVETGWALPSGQVVSTDRDVGIGTSQPAAALDVHGDTRLDGVVSFGLIDEGALPPPQADQEPAISVHSSSDGDRKTYTFWPGHNTGPIAELSSFSGLSGTFFFRENRLTIPRPDGSGFRDARLFVEGDGTFSNFVQVGNWLSVSSWLRADEGLSIGTGSSPDYPLHVDSDEDGIIAAIDSDGQAGLRVRSNRSVTIGSPWLSPPDSGLLVDGLVAISEFTNADIEVCRTVLGALGNCSSSARYKEQINDLENAQDIIGRLRPVEYVWTEGQRADIGLIAEEVAEVLPAIVTENDQGQIEGVQYSRLPALLIAAFQEREHEVDARVAALELENRQLRGEVATLRDGVEQAARLAARNAELEERLATLEALMLDNRQLTSKP